MLRFRRAAEDGQSPALRGRAGLCPADRRDILRPVVVLLLLLATGCSQHDHSSKNVVKVGSFGGATLHVPEQDLLR